MECISSLFAGKVKSVYSSASSPKITLVTGRAILWETLFNSNASAFLNSYYPLESRNSKITPLQKPGFLIFSQRFNDKNTQGE